MCEEITCPLLEKLRQEVIKQQVEIDELKKYIADELNE